MSAISRQRLIEINNMINKDVELIERKKFSNLIVGRMYIIKKIVFMTTRFGPAIVVTLFDSLDNVTFQTFLPKRVVETLSEDMVKTMNSSPDDKYTLTYLGQSTTVYSGGKTKALLNFGILEQ
jgi:hypothetical protein